MRAASSALIALLNAGTEFCVADLLTIALASGTVVRITNAPVDVTAVSRFDGVSHTFAAGGLQFSRDAVSQSVGLDVDAMGLTLLTSPATQSVNGLSWPAAARQGALDEARIVVERAYMATWGDTSAGTLIVFWGRAGVATPSRNTVAITVQSELALLDLPMPRNSFGPGCLHALYDAGCTLLASAFTSSNAAASGSTAAAVHTTLPQADKYFELGVLTFTSGVNAGIPRTVKSHVGGVVTVSPPFPAAPGVGDTFTIYPGCDKSQATCTTKFANLAHFRGYPYIPPPEAAS